MTLPPHIRALVFDCDGTLADTMPNHYKAWCAMLAHYGHPFPEPLFYAFAGTPTNRIIELLNRDHGYHVPVHEGTEMKERLFEDMIPLTKPIPEVVAIADAYPHLPQAVATGAYRDACLRTLGAIGLAGRFTAIATAEDTKHGKPAPDVFLHAAKLLNIDPNLCAAFEDADLGLQSARAAGMLAIDIRPLRKPATR